MISPYVLAIDLAGLSLVVVGLHLAFRQAKVKEWWSRLKGVSPPPAPASDEDDPARYAMRIAGVMIAVFGFILSVMLTLVAAAA